MDKIVEVTLSQGKLVMEVNDSGVHKLRYDNFDPVGIVYWDNGEWVFSQKTIKPLNAAKLLDLQLFLDYLDENHVAEIDKQLDTSA